MLNTWQTFAIISGFLLAGNILLRKYLFNIGCSFYDVTIPFIFIQGVCYILFSIYLCLHEKRALLPKNKKLRYKILFITLLSSIVVTLGIYCRSISIFYVDNTARTDAITQAFKLFLLFLVSIFIFKNEFVLTHFIGILFAVTGIYLVSK